MRPFFALLCWLSGLSIALGIMLSAPGNAVRQSYAGHSLLYALQGTGEWLVSLPGAFAFALPAFALVVLVGMAYPVKVKRQTVLVAWLITFLSAIGVMFAGVYGSNTIYHHRLLVIPLALFLLSLWLTGCTLATTRKRLLNALLILALCLMTLQSALNLADAAVYAVRWTQRDNALTAGVVDVPTIPALRPRDTLLISPNLKACMAVWYRHPVNVEG